MTNWQDLVARLESVGVYCDRRGGIYAAETAREAAALIERQAQEIERLRDILDQIESMNRIGLEDICAIARAALAKASAAENTPPQAPPAPR